MQFISYILHRLKPVLLFCYRDVSLYIEQNVCSKNTKQIAQLRRDGLYYAPRRFCFELFGWLFLNLSEIGL